MSNVTLISPERIRRRMAGVGVRYLEMARSLSRNHVVTLLAPNEDLPSEPGIHLATYQAGRFQELTRKADVVVIHGHISNQLLREVDGIPTVVDLYDPFLVENMHYAPHMGEDVFLFDHATLLEQLRRGDFFLCSSPSQRLFYLGMLAALGRVNPESFLEDRNLDQLISLVPFGIPRREPVHREMQIRGIVEGIGPDDVLLFYGGIYDWHDPMIALQALEILEAQKGPEKGQRGVGPKLLFVKNPNPDSTPQRQFDLARKFCRERGWEGSRVCFLEWIDYEKRDSVYLECDLAVASFAHSLEVDLSFRTRVLDWLWCGLPVVVTDGGWTGSLLREEKAGVVVEPGDPKALASAIRSLLRDPARRRDLATNGQRLVRSRFQWDQLLEPLDRFCQHPKIAAGKKLAARTQAGHRGGNKQAPLGRRLLQWLGGSKC